MALEHIPKITIEIVAHGDQRYPTVGDWTYDKDKGVTIYVSRMSNWKFEASVAIHELIEVLDCIDKGVSQETVDAFDSQFEELREDYPDIIGETEPGNMPSAPYHESHELATVVEKQYILGNRLNWEEYDKYINNL